MDTWGKKLTVKSSQSTISEGRVVEEPRSAIKKKEKAYAEDTENAEGTEKIRLEDV